MIAPSARRTVAVAAAIVTGAAASAFGQQVANLDDQQGLRAHLKIECPQGGDPCEIPAAKKFFDALTAQRLKSAAEADKRAADADKRAAEHRAATEATKKKSAADTAAHQKTMAKSDEAIAASRTRAQCLSDISGALTANPPRITVAEARAAKTTPTPSDDPCVWRERLVPRLGALTKQ